MAIEFLAQASEGVGGVLNPLENVLNLLQQFGFFKVVLPFLLIFALVYAVILKTGILGDPATNAWVRPIASIIAFVAGFLVVAYTPVVEAIERVVPQAGFLLLVVLLLLMVLGMLGFPITEKFTGKLAPIALIIGLVVVAIFLAIVGAAVGPQIPILYSFAQFMMGMIPIELTSEQIALLLAFLIIIGIPAIILAIIYYTSK
ncbi:MAG: hypothetical protein QXQ79_00325 [Candidatus Nanoarchaeia archaeon]